MIAGQTYLSSLHELHDQEEVLIIFVDVKELDYVGVIDLFEDIYLVLETNFVFLGKFAPKTNPKILFTLCSNSQVHSCALLWSVIEHNFRLKIETQTQMINNKEHRW